MNKNTAKTLYKTIQLYRNEPVFACLDELEKSQWYPKEKLGNIQWERLKKLLEHAYNTVPFYKQRFDGAGLKPEDIKSKNDLLKLPVLTKKQIKDNSEALISSQKMKTDRLPTAGSSGDPLIVRRNMLSTAYSRAAKYRGHRWFDIEIGEKEARIWGESLDKRGRSKEAIKDFLMNRTRWSAYNLTPTALRAFYEKLLKYRPAYFYGYASLLYEYASYLIENSLDLKPLGLKAAISTSETLTEKQRKTISKAFCCPVVNEYGCTETGIIAFECPSGGMHIPIEAVYVEIIPETIEGGGKMGRVVVTDLHNYSMPIIRYEIGDLAESSTESRCKCGRELPLIGNITGRTSDILYTKDGRKIHTIIFYYLFCNLEMEGIKIEKYQVIREKNGRLVLNIVPSNDITAAQIGLIKKMVEDIFGGSGAIDVVCVKYIPRAGSGKCKDFIDERK
jgi:phenylacetate-CoA ligase